MTAPTHRRQRSPAGQPTWLARFAASPTSLSIAKLASMILPLLTAPLVARHLGPHDRGLYGACIGALTLTPVILGMGLPLAVRRLAALGSGPKAARGAYITCALMTPFGALLGAGVAAAFIPGLDAHAGLVFVLAMAATTLQTCALCLQSVLITQRRYGAVALIQSCLSLAMTIGTLIAWTLGRISITWLVGSFIVGAALSLMAAVFLTRIRPFGERSRQRELIAEGATYAGSQVAEVGANTLLQVLAVTVIGAHQAGLFAIAMTIAGLPLVIGHTLGIVSYQRMAVAEPAAAAMLSAFTVRAALILGFLSAAPLALATPIAVPLLFGKAFEDAVAPTLIALIGSVLLVANYVVSQLLAAHGRGWSMSAAQILGLGSSVVALLVFGPEGGAAAAAAAVIVGRVLAVSLGTASLPSTFLNHIPRPRDVRPAFAMLLKGRVPELVR